MAHKIKLVEKIRYKPNHKVKPLSTYPLYTESKQMLEL